MTQLICAQRSRREPQSGKPKQSTPRLSVNRIALRLRMGRRRRGICAHADVIGIVHDEYTTKKVFASIKIN